MSGLTCFMAFLIPSRFAQRVRMRSFCAAQTLESSAWRRRKAVTRCAVLLDAG